jgi:cell division protein ZapA (FtsZ GTPase activity inhibitor)
MSKDVSDKVKKYKVSIFGESYLLVSDETEEHIMAAAQLVDSSMRHIAEKSQIAESKRIAVLVALQCASNVLATKAINDQCQQHSDKLIDFVNRELSRFSTL